MVNLESCRFENYPVFSNPINRFMKMKNKFMLCLMVICLLRSNTFRNYFYKKSYNGCSENVGKNLETGKDGGCMEV